MELKEVLNKSAVSAARLDRSVDVSYTEEQMLTALDSLTADSRFVPGERCHHYRACDSLKLWFPPKACRESIVPILVFKTLVSNIFLKSRKRR